MFNMMWLAVLVSSAVCVSGAIMESHSFGGPFGAINDNGQRYINSTWTTGGSTEVKKNFIRLTPDRQSKRGYIWNENILNVDSFTAILNFRISGQGKRWFGDGIGLWLTQHRNYVGGDNHGFTSEFYGVGIVLDTFINPEHKGGHRDITIQVNNGTKTLDILNEETKIGCNAPLRYHEESAAFNPVHSASRIKVTVDKNRLNIAVDEKAEGKWTPCYDGELPFSQNWLLNTAIGISAATGSLADNHDILMLRSFDSANDETAVTTDSETMLHSISKEYKKWVNDASCGTECLIAVLTKEIDNFRIEAEHRLADLNEKTANTIAKLRVQEQENEDKLNKMYDQIMKKVDTDLASNINQAAYEVSTSIEKKVEDKIAPGSHGWKTPFFILLVSLIAAAGYVYKKYQTLRKSHLL